MANVEIEGMNALVKTIKKLEVLPQKVVTKSARKGAKIAQDGAKQGGWVDDTGNLRKAIKLKGERSRLKGKKVYQVSVDPKGEMNSTFQKQTKTGTIIDNKTGKTRKGSYYYPASIEYGFRTVNGGYVPGFHFMRDGMTENKQLIERTIISNLSKEIDNLKKVK